ncbi:MAG: hypothetical protein JWQ01_4933 [Massilia sp.]|nr:hypothetical protein [Massilia sp.]
MKPPEYKPPVDPTLDAQAHAAEADKINALQARVTGDTAQVMQRYGTAVAMSGAAIPSPIKAVA